MARSALLGSTAFAHLLGRSAKRAEDDREEEDKEKDKDAKRAGENGDDERPDDDDKKDKDAKAARADDDDEGQDASEDEDEDEKDKKDAKASAARGRERARCAAIFGSQAAGTRPDVAAHLAFETSLTRTEACAILKAVAAGEKPAPKAAGLAARMQGMETVRPGQDGAAAPTGRQAVASTWDAAAKRAGIAR